MSLVIQEHARARLITDGPDPRLVPVELLYDAEEPGTVHVRLPGGVDWAFGLDLLERGLRSPPRAATYGYGPAAGPSWWWSCTRRTGWPSSSSTSAPWSVSWRAPARRR